MNDLVTKEEINIEDMIYEIRGKQVILDSDLAKLYGTETKRINEAVKNNPEKFPERFCFKLTDKETLKLEVENFDLKLNKYGGRRYNPRVFTEQGIAMLATILKTKVAVEVSLAIIDAFVSMRKYITNSIDYNNRISNIETKIIEHDSNFNILFEKLDQKEKINHLFFDG